MGPYVVVVDGVRTTGCIGCDGTLVDLIRTEHGTATDWVQVMVDVDVATSIIVFRVGMLNGWDTVDITVLVCVTVSLEGKINDMVIIWRRDSMSPP